MRREGGEAEDAAQAAAAAAEAFFEPVTQNKEKVESDKVSEDDKAQPAKA